VQGDPLHTLNPPKVREHPGQRMVLAKIGVAIGRDQIQRPVLDGTNEMLEQRHRLTVGPMQII
jgi:hypothetical protein